MAGLLLSVCIQLVQLYFSFSPPAVTSPAPRSLQDWAMLDIGFLRLCLIQTHLLLRIVLVTGSCPSYAVHAPQTGAVEPVCGAGDASVDLASMFHIHRATLSSHWS